MSVQGQPSANPMVASSQIVNAYASFDREGASGPVGLEEESPLRDARGFDMARQVADPTAADRRGPRAGQRHPQQRRPPLRRPRAPGVLLARGDDAARRGALGEGGGAGHARRLPDGGAGARQRADPALQEQHRQQGRVLRRPRELPDAPLDPLRRDRAAPDAVLRLAAGRHRRRPRRHRPGRPRHDAGAGLPDQPARRLLRGRGRARDHAQAADHQHPRRAARRPRGLPPAARHPGRRQPRRDLDLPQGRHHLAGAGDDRGRLHRPRPLGGGSGGSLREVRTTRPCATSSRCATDAG